MQSRSRPTSTYPPACGRSGRQGLSVKGDSQANEGVEPANKRRPRPTEWCIRSSVPPPSCPTLIRLARASKQECLWVEELNKAARSTKCPAERGAGGGEHGGPVRPNGHSARSPDAHARHDAGGNTLRV